MRISIRYFGLYISIYISTWIFEKVAPEDLPVLTGTRPKPCFYDSNEPPNHTGEKRGGRGERGEEKRTPGTHNFYIAYFGDPRSSIVIGCYTKNNFQYFVSFP